MKPIFWIKNESQKKRFEDHKASVTESEDGSLLFETENIITPKGLTKSNRLISVVPKPTETIVPLSSVPYLFQDLKQMNLILMQNQVVKIILITQTIRVDQNYYMVKLLKKKLGFGLLQMLMIILSFGQLPIV
jgi:hypothetical protein